MSTESSTQVLFKELIAKFKEIHAVKPFAGCEELYKWQLITACKDKTNLEIADIVAKKQKNLLSTYDSSTLKRTILKDENGRAAFDSILKNLFAEEVPLEDRLVEYKNAQKRIWPNVVNLPDDNRSAAVFLTCKDPNRYSFTTWTGVYRKLCQYIGVKERTDAIFLPHYLQLLEPLKELVSVDTELKRMVKDSTPDCMQSDLLTAQTIVYCMLFSYSKNEPVVEGAVEQKPEEKLYTPIIGSNVIFYGAPGTGKSYHIDHDVIRASKNYKRTTFHPDTDYSAFVGCYKPTRDRVEGRITYKFVSQIFVKAYVEAWRDRSQEMYLVIEEINRGNCAQIFGDLFQLLDRDDLGWSCYDIEPDSDLQECLALEFAKPENALDDRELPENVARIINNIKSGEKLLLPNNLFVWATMNTSDQSLFPIDSAFKRRWDWKYMPIAKGHDEEGNELNWRIAVNGKEYDWWSFLEKINEVIGSTTNSEDKKLGFFFCKARNGVIDAETFVSKVIFYLWNDVFKDYGFDSTIFSSEDGALEFHKFYESDNFWGTNIAQEKVDGFLHNLNVAEVSVQEVSEDPDGDDVTNDNNGTELQKKQLRFWQEYNRLRKDNVAYCEVYGERAAVKSGDMDLSFGTSAYWPYLKATFTKSFVRCGIWIGSSSKKDEINKAFTDNIEGINELVGVTMDYGSTTKAHYFSTTKNIDLNDESNWPEAINWLQDMALKMKEVKTKYGK